MSNTSTGYTSADYGQGEMASGEPQNWSNKACNELSRAVDENPSGTLLTAFAAGLGLGVAVGLTLAFSSARPKPRNRAEELGHRIFESLQDYIPDSVSRRFG